MSTEAERIFRALQSLDDRITGLQGELETKVARPLTEEETQWVRLSIQREAQSVKLRQAVIEKTLAGLVWAAVLGLGVLVVEYLKNHGWKA